MSRKLTSEAVREPGNGGLKNRPSSDRGRPEQAAIFALTPVTGPLKKRIACYAPRKGLTRDGENFQRVTRVERNSR